MQRKLALPGWCHACMVNKTMSSLHCMLKKNYTCILLIQWESDWDTSEHKNLNTILSGLQKYIIQVSNHAALCAHTISIGHLGHKVFSKWACFSSGSNYHAYLNFTSYWSWIWKPHLFMNQIPNVLNFFNVGPNRSSFILFISIFVLNF